MLLIHNTLDAIQHAQAILDFRMLAQYISNDKETLRYIEHWLYRLKKIKIVFEWYRPIDSKLCWPRFYYPKFHAISHFIQCIRDDGSAVNYDTGHNEAAHKYFLKTFYNRTNKKENELQIRQYNVRHTNIIVRKDVIILEKTREKEKLSEGPVDTTASAKIAQASSSIDLAWKYGKAISKFDIEAAKKLGPTGVKNYWRRAGQVEIELDWLYD